MLYVHTYKKLPNIAVNLSFSVKSNPLHFQMCPHTAEMDMRSAVLYALFENVRSKVLDSVQGIAKSKVDHIGCVSTGSRLAISWTTMATTSALRKSLSMALAALSPAKMYPRVQAIMKESNRKADRDEFEKEAAVIASCLSSVSVLVVGRISESASLDKIKELLASFTALHNGKSSDKYSFTLPSSDINFSSHKAAVLAYDYVRNLSGRPVEVAGSHMYVRGLTDAIKRKLADKDRVKTYTAAQEKIKEREHVLAYFLSVHHLTDSETLKQVISNASLNSLSELSKLG
jgi:hypothetical protein